MKKKKLEELQKAYDALKECEDLITDRIFENNTVGKGMLTKQATHAYVLYRKLIWDAKYIIRDLLGEKSG